jgi:hypothetical protein
MLAYHVGWHMRQALAPMLFDDHDRAGAEALRSSPVAKAQPSPAAKRNTVRWSCAPAIASPTQIQQRAFDLLGVKLQL